LNLAKHPIIQQQVYEECQEILSGKTFLSLQDLKQMSFLEKVIKESLRLYPSVIFFTFYLKFNNFKIL
jgi:cytochrome P450